MELFDLAVARAKRLFVEGTPVTVSCSFGKDSSAVLAVTLEAAIQAKAEGFKPFVIVTHADTGVENPEMRNYADREIEKLRSFCDQTGLDVEIKVAAPALNASWAVRIISGRGMPSFPGGAGDCTTDLKILPMARLVKEVFASIEARFQCEPVTVIGTRFVVPSTVFIN